jgi:hypothetical protein
MDFQADHRFVAHISIIRMVDACRQAGSILPPGSLCHHIFDHLAQGGDIQVFLVQKCNRAGFQAEPVNADLSHSTSVTSMSWSTRKP